MLWLFKIFTVLLALAATADAAEVPDLDEASALWSRYQYAFMESGRVIARDEGDVTTSEGQSYALLRAVWSGDRRTFDDVLAWTEAHLQVRPDRLFAWRYAGGRVTDPNTASDADVDIGLALLIASHRFGAEVYADKARAVIHDIGRKDVARLGGRLYLTAGSWTEADPFPRIHPAYYAPYAYEQFAEVDDSIAWHELVGTTYDLLRWIYADQHLKLPPEFLFVDRATGARLLRQPRTGQTAGFGYDSVPLFWRIALDRDWNGRSAERDVRASMLAFFAAEWTAHGRLSATYTLAGQATGTTEGQPLYATVHALARELNPDLAAEIRRHKLRSLWDQGLGGPSLPYYLDNWLWFDRAAELGETRSFDEFLGFLRPFDLQGFLGHFRLWAMVAAVGLFVLSRYHAVFKVAFLGLALGLCVEYLGWRLAASLNFAETAGPAISLTLWAAEAYGLMTIAMLLIQVGLKPKGLRPRPQSHPDFSVDIMIPIYSESLEILEATLVGATSIAYANKKVHVLDDSHRDSVRALAEEFGAHYIKGPKQHAKAGNLNHAMKETQGDLIVVFDTDHIPVTSFLSETVPYFADPALGVVQTPHVFYNEDIFQRALGGRLGSVRLVGNEQDMFNHGIQGGRDGWGGAFFVGSGAVFRRAAIASVGGFNLLSITEDIHTSQHLHAKGWRSVFVDRNLAVGLAAESLAGFTVQRRRWMLGCLQIFFKDNPMFVKGLPLRHRLGYLASLSYFFFPAARAVFWVTPIWYLLFHWHPLLAEVSILLAYLVPFLLLRPLVTAVLLPGWPRMLWGELYEVVCSFTLFRAMFDLLLPKSLAFKVTPKGVTSDRRAFDHRSARATMIAAAISVVAIVKGAVEFSYFGIEKEAYFFNIGWAAFNLLFLFAALLLAWERPQRRGQERLPTSLPVTLRWSGGAVTLPAWDVSLSGIAVRSEQPLTMTGPVTVGLGPLELRATPVYQERVGRKRLKLALRFDDPSTGERRSLIQLLFTRPEAWADRHEQRSRSNLVVALAFLVGLVKAVRLPSRRARLAPRRARWRPLTLVTPAAATRFWQRDASDGGLALLCWRRPALPAGPLLVLCPKSGRQWAETVYVKRLGVLWRWGLRHVPAPALEPKAFAYLTTLVLAMVLASVPSSVARADAFSESWYLLRGRANMQIGNHKAAIEAFDKACELNPGNREAMKSLGLAYAQEGLTDKAVAQFDRYLSRFKDDPEIAFKQADFLSWSRYEYRRNDAIAYLRSGLSLKDDPRERRRLAKLLGRDRSTLEEALTEYETLLSAAPADEDLRGDYRKLLAWDKRYQKEAIKEYRSFVQAHPKDATAALELARLLAQAGDPEAAEVYDGLVAKRPADANLRLAYARVLAEQSGRESDAAREYATVLKHKPELAVRVEYADQLARQPSARREALREYQEVLKRAPGDKATRLHYARLLSADRADAPEAARQYEQILQRDPHNPEAHRGAAHAYAWIGDKDRALYHSQQAAKGGDVASLTQSLMKGREPRVGGTIHFLDQPGDAFRIRGGEAGAFAKHDLGAFASGRVEAGYERYDGALADGSDATRDGAYGTLGAEYRFSETHRIDLALGYHALAPDASARSTGKLELTLGDEALQIVPGVRRDLRTDSLPAVAASRETMAFTTLRWGGDWRLAVTPSAGSVTTAGEDGTNPLQMLDATLEHDLLKEKGVILTGVYTLQAAHYNDQRPGYFSPSQYLAQTPSLALRWEEPEAVQGEVRAGPSLQYSRTDDEGTKVVVGADAHAYLGLKNGPFELDVTAAYLRLPDLGARVDAGLAAACLF